MVLLLQYIWIRGISLLLLQVRVDEQGSDSTRTAHCESDNAPADNHPPHSTGEGLDYCSKSKQDIGDEYDLPTTIFISQNTREGTRDQCK
jgi:hypothetical protein